MASCRSEPIKSFLITYSEEIEADNAAIFAGAGLSRAAGFVDWKLLLKSVATSLDLDIEKESNLVALAQYYCNARLGSRGRINKLLLDKFSRDAEITANHRILARLPISTYWTTNYDRLIEKALDDAGKRADVKYSDRPAGADRAASRRRRLQDARRYFRTVEDRADQGRLREVSPFTRRLHHRVDRRSRLQDLPLSWLQLQRSEHRLRPEPHPHQLRHQHAHPLLLHEDGGGERLSGEDKETVNYKKRQQSLFINDLLRFNVETLMLDSYAQITEMLTESGAHLSQQVDLHLRRRA